MCISTPVTYDEDERRKIVFSITKITIAGRGEEEETRLYSDYDIIVTCSRLRPNQGSSPNVVELETVELEEDTLGDDDEDDEVEKTDLPPLPPGKPFFNQELIEALFRPRRIPESLRAALGENNPFSIDTFSLPDHLMSGEEAGRILEEYGREDLTDPNGECFPGEKDTLVLVEEYGRVKGIETLVGSDGENWEIIRIGIDTNDTSTTEGKLQFYAQQADILPIENGLITSIFVSVPIKILGTNGSIFLFFVRLSYKIIVSFDPQDQNKPNQVKIEIEGPKLGTTTEEKYGSAFDARNIFISLEEKERNSKILELTERITELLGRVGSSLFNLPENAPRNEDILRIEELASQAQNHVDLREIMLLLNNIEAVSTESLFVEQIANIIRDRINNSSGDTGDTTEGLELKPAESQDAIRKAFDAIAKEFNIRRVKYQGEDEDIDKFINILAIYIFIRFKRKQEVVDRKSKESLLSNLKEALYKRKDIFFDLIGRRVDELVRIMISPGSAGRLRDEIDSVIDGIV